MYAQADTSRLLHPTDSATFGTKRDNVFKRERLRLRHRRVLTGKKTLIYKSDIQKSNAKIPDKFINRSTKWREHPLSSPDQWYLEIAKILSVLQHTNDNASLYPTHVPSHITKSKR
jgi:hypothetical protein